MKDIVAGIVNQFETGRLSRRQLIEGLTIAATAAVASPAVAAAPAAKGFKATSINHLSFGVPDYAKARDFYVDLLGFEVQKGHGACKKCPDSKCTQFSWASWLELFERALQKIR